MKEGRFYLTLLMMGMLLAWNSLTAQDNTLNNGRDDAMSIWKGEVIRFRTDKDMEFKHSPTSPMASKQRITQTFEPGKPIYFSETNRTVTLSLTPGSNDLFSVSQRDQVWTWTKLAPTVNGMDGSKPLADGAPLPASAQFSNGQCVMKAYFSPTQVLVIVFDDTQPKIHHFNQLLYYPPDPVYAVPATLEKLADRATFTFTTSRNLKKQYYRFARIHFTLNGKKLTLTAFKSSLADDEEGHILFIPFTDPTNGSETYEIGRFLEIPEPQSDSFILDFNYCFNPLCNYSDHYNCPIPPQENALAVPIYAGEKTYPH